MHLVGFNEARQLFHSIRDLNENEVANYEKYTPIIAEAKNRFKLFRILGYNYNDWIAYINSLLNSQPRNDENDWLQLDRLMLNYLTCAYTIQEHFMVSFRRRFRKDKIKSKEYADFVNGLCHTSWAFAFFLDFRGYIQHCELGIGQYRRHASLTSIEISITHEAANLLADSKEWKRCKLTETRGTINLVELLNEFHHHMLQSYGKYVARAFFPELIPAARFYAELSKEVQNIGPGFKMLFLDGEPQIRFEQGSQEVSLRVKHVPNDLFAELGISVSVKT